MKPDRNIEVEKNIRQRIIEVLELISSPQDQVKYQQNVKFIYVPYEIIEQWYDWVDSKHKYLKSDSEGSVGSQRAGIEAVRGRQQL